MSYNPIFVYLNIKINFNINYYKSFKLIKL